MNVVECPLIERPWPEQWLDASRELLTQTLEQMPDEARLLALLAIQRFPEHGERNLQLAEELGVPEELLMLGTISYDIAMTFGCSTMAVATAEGPVLARNMDWFPERAIARASCITRLDHGWSAGFVGTVGVVTGLSERGFAVALNAVAHPESDRRGYPMLLFLRHLLDSATDFDHAVEIARRTPLASSGLLTLVGTRNDQRICIERTPSQHRLIRPEGDAALVTTNHFRLMEPETSCVRWSTVTSSAKTLSRMPGDSDFLQILTHPQVEQSITAQHVIATPSQQRLKMWVPARLLE
ncbi:C45 family peptidase [Tuwongella immobilis]|uniref:Peptidase C45 hydrolase domain-containing protein n=1 Tax=Tuwongella immobilis TaxID=692036 RepID=A0A6C2YR86_9BACT|nr:C45 family peptidase [Tuwongella immobilis]VIP03867.1 Peptidase C45 acyl-coenzyme A:6-aminopenicillanic acid acyl-transferase OS=Deinococcus maricopensis (strain DSM 21211 / LMG 22137 / NRRL B-23946 / LB-34) GN=Deima_2897 PE=4 SV=1: AAT [Tuwongella immobilis]VTS05101.1 Peptidase C45 acyl-coenzyme A:6-aminopenicillanic acid acyl-transferase OS=Deinococcus maricopensis (strain DSM 21211 / LMG 22137 / NRRL B-23946 / LB-34) GN=Deima_2897 PE=4 SV=1: AAT [Tuwongella immobilis]